MRRVVRLKLVLSGFLVVRCVVDFISMLVVLLIIGRVIRLVILVVRFVLRVF